MRRAASPEDDLAARLLWRGKPRDLQLFDRTEGLYRGKGTSSIATREENGGEALPKRDAAMYGNRYGHSI